MSFTEKHLTKKNICFSNMFANTSNDVLGPTLGGECAYLYAHTRITKFQNFKNRNIFPKHIV